MASERKKRRFLVDNNLPLPPDIQALLDLSKVKNVTLTKRSTPMQITKQITNEALRRRTVSMRLPQWVIDWLREEQARGRGIGDLVEHALVEHYRISKEPKRSLRR